MEKILRALIGCGVLVYLDDVFFYAATLKQLLDKLFQVLKLLATAGLKCKSSKCSVFTQKVHYLGHIISKEGINPESAKLEKISKWPKPEKGTRLASFLGLCNYYRDLIPNIAHIRSPLYKVSTSSIVELTPELNLSLKQLKQQLLEFRIVRMPYPQRVFILETDGSRIALGAVLKQKFDETVLENLSLKQLKQQLLECRIVRMPYPQRDFILQTDGSRIALGAYSSRSLMKRYSNTQ